MIKRLKIEEGNIKDRINRNSVYFVTLILCVTLFYTFLSIGDPKNPIIANNLSYDFSFYAPIIRYCVYGVSITIVFIINYVNRYIFKLRLKEISVLNTLGMERKKLAILFSKEMFHITIIAFVLGVGIGNIFSFIITKHIAFKTIQSINGNFVFYSYTTLLTILYFALMYGMITLLNIYKISKWKPIDLIQEEKQIEGHYISRLRKVVIILLLIGSYGFIIYNFNIYFSIGRHYQGVIPHYESNIFQAAIFVGIFIAIYSTFYSVIIITTELHKKKSRYVKERLFTQSNLKTRLHSNLRLMIGLTLVFTIAICAFIFSPILSKFAKEFYQYRMAYDINIPFNYNSIYSIDDIPDIDYSFVENILEKNNVELEDKIELKQYFIWESDFNNPATRNNKYDFPRLATDIDSYNKLREMGGHSKVNLRDNEFLMHMKADSDVNLVITQLKEDGGHRLKIANEIIKQKEGQFLYTDSLGNYLYNINTNSFLVFPNNICKRLNLAKVSFFANTKEEIPYKDCKDIEEQITDTFRIEYQKLYTKYESKEGKDFVEFIQPIRFDSIERTDIEFMSLITELLGLYIGVIFMMISISILSIQALVDGEENKEMFFTLYILGMEKNRIKKLNFQFIKGFFILPILISIINFIIIQYSFYLRYKNRLKYLLTKEEYLTGTVLPLITSLAIIIIYFLVTVRLNNRKIEDTR